MSGKPLGEPDLAESGPPVQPTSGPPSQPPGPETSASAGSDETVATPGDAQTTAAEPSAEASPGPDASSADAEAGPPSSPDATETDPAATAPRGGKPDRRRRVWRRIGIIAAAVVAALAVSYGVAYLVAGDTLARGATVAGVPVGGMRPPEAEAALAEALPAVVDQPVHLVVDEQTTFEVVPSEVGLTVDIPATVAAVPGGSANPVSLVKALIGAGDIQPVPSVDRAAVAAAVTGIAEQADVEPVNGAVAFEDGAVVTSEPVAGRAVDVDASVSGLIAAFFGGPEPTSLPLSDVPLVVEEVPPAVDAAEVERVVNEFAEPAMSAPVTLAAGDRSVTLEPELIGQALTLSPDDAGTLQPALDGAKLSDVAHDVLAQIGQEGKDATIVIDGGKPVVVPGRMGQGIEPDALSAAVLPALTQTGSERRAQVELTEVEPELTTEAARDLGVTEVVSEFTTRFPHAHYRNVNIGTAAARIDDTLLLPGEEFSLNRIVGERTQANGFTVGTIINGGRLREELGGGVSQVATTTFHAAFQAGLEDVEHWPHSIYFDRYPVGQEATVAWGAKDMRFRNDTPYGVVVDTIFSPSAPGRQGSLTVKIWSTKHFRVQTSVSDRYDHTAPRTIYDTADTCMAQGGSQGFSITSYRKVWTPDGTLAKDESSSWTYNPNHRVVCGPDPSQQNETRPGPPTAQPSPR